MTSQTVLELLSEALTHGPLTKVSIPPPQPGEQILTELTSPFIPKLLSVMDQIKKTAKSSIRQKDVRIAVDAVSELIQAEISRELKKLENQDIPRGHMGAIRQHENKLVFVATRTMSTGQAVVNIHDNSDTRTESTG